MSTTLWHEATPIYHLTFCRSEVGGGARVFLGSMLSRTRPNSKFKAGLGSYVEIWEESTFTLPLIIG